MKIEVCFEGYLFMYQERFKGIASKFQSCFKEVSGVFRE